MLLKSVTQSEEPTALLTLYLISQIEMPGFVAIDMRSTKSLHLLNAGPDTIRTSSLNPGCSVYVLAVGLQRLFVAPKIGWRHASRGGQQRDVHVHLVLAHGRG